MNREEIVSHDQSKFALEWQQTLTLVLVHRHSVIVALRVFYRQSLRHEKDAQKALGAWLSPNRSEGQVAQVSRKNRRQKLFPNFWHL